MTIIKLSEKKPVPDVIEFIEGLLEQAKSGDLVGIAIIGVMSDGCSGNGWNSIEENVMKVLGEISVLQRDIMDVNVDLRIDPVTGDGS